MKMKNKITLSVLAFCVACTIAAGVLSQEKVNATYGLQHFMDSIVATGCTEYGISNFMLWEEMTTAEREKFKREWNAFGNTIYKRNYHGCTFYIDVFRKEDVKK